MNKGCPIADGFCEWNHLAEHLATTTRKKIDHNDSESKGTFFRGALWARSFRVSQLLAFLVFLALACSVTHKTERNQSIFVESLDAFAQNQRETCLSARFDSI